MLQNSITGQTLLRTNSRTTMAHINRQGRFQFTALLKLSGDVWLLVLEHLEYGGANLMTGGSPWHSLPVEWGLHPIGELD